MSFKKVENSRVQSDSDDDQFVRQDNRDVFQRYYEGGAKDRINDKYGDDV